MTQQSENKSISLEEILKILRFQADQMPPSPTSARYRHALTSFSSRRAAEEQSPQEVILGQRSEPSQPPSAPSADPLSNELDPQAASAPLPLSVSITDWLVSLWLTGTPFTTASLYLDIISSLYGSAAKAGQLPRTDLFKQLKISLKTLGPEGWKSGIDDEIFERALRLTKNAASLVADDAIAADLVLWSLTHGLMPLTDIALLRPSHAGTAGEVGPQKNIIPALPASQRPQREVEEAIIARHCKSARRKYIFPLHQSQRTEPQLRKHIAKIVNALFKRTRLPQATDPYQTVEALWAYAALRTGVPASALVSYLGHAPLGLPILRLSHAEVTLGQRSEPSQPSSAPSGSRAEQEDQRINYSSSGLCPSASLREVGRVFLENPPRWYALSLRPGVRFTQLCRRLELLLKTEDSRLKTLKDLRLFYPCEEIARAIGKKIVVRERPFIRSVVFFQAKLTDIGRLFARIGDLAWCYRQSARPGAPYADISQAQFRQFQQTIARFTPDYEVAPIGELEPRPNDRVQILGGLFAGHEATMEGVVPMGGRFPNRPGSSDSEAGSMTGPRRQPKEDKSASAGLSPGENPSIIYRLNIIGDNGFDWRIRVDSRLTK